MKQTNIYDQYFEDDEEGRDPRFPSGWYILPLLGVSALVCFIFAATLAFGQSTSGAASQSASSNKNINASVSAAQGGSVIFPSVPSNTKETVRYEGSYRIDSAPAVSAPAIFGGGHPCLAGKSGGVSIVGGGFSYGQGDPEPACMAYIMGQPEIALNIMAGSNPAFLRATCRVGFWRVGNAKVPVKCGKDGLPSAQASSKSYQPLPVPPKTSALLSKCAFEDGKVKVRYTSAGRKDKDAANKLCIARLGL